MIKYIGDLFNYSKITYIASFCFKYCIPFVKYLSFEIKRIPLCSLAIIERIACGTISLLRNVENWTEQARIFLCTLDQGLS